MATTQIAHTRPSKHSDPVYDAREHKRLRWRKRLECVMVILLSDAVTVGSCFVLTLTIYNEFIVRLKSAPPPLIAPRDYFRVGWEWVLVLVFMCAEGLYTQRRTVWSEVGHLTKAVVMGSIAVWAVIAFDPFPLLFSRFSMAATATLILCTLPLTRYWTKRLLFLSGIWRKRILVLGSTENARLAINGLRQDHVFGYDPVGLLDNEPGKVGQCLRLGNEPVLTVLGTLSQATYWMEKTGAVDILIAMPELRDDKLLAFISKLQPMCESVLVIPQLWALPMMNLEVDGFFRERTLLLKLTNNLAKPWNMWLKRGCDLLLGGILTCLTIPLYAAIALLVKLDSPGPVLFTQTRLGFRDSLFQCLKFRTMYTDADERLERYLESNPDARNELIAYAKLRNFDPRVTRIGRFLRTWSLDELPQLFNVLKGDMSLVGPRPYLPAERSRMGAHLPTILSARPGISGLWQVNGRNQLTFETRVQLEEWYVRHWGIWLDCIVLIKTLKAVFFSDATQEQLEWDPDSDNSAELGDLPGRDGWEKIGSAVHEQV